MTRAKLETRLARLGHLQSRRADPVDIPDAHLRLEHADGRQVLTEGRNLEGLSQALAEVAVVFVGKDTHSFVGTAVVLLIGLLVTGEAEEP